MTQTVWIARHGNRLDFVNPEWFNTAERRYDPPLSEDGLIQAKQLGQRLLGETIKHIFASPFLRAVQPANQVAEAQEKPKKQETRQKKRHNPAWMNTEPERLSIEALQEQFPRIEPSYTSRVIAKYPETSEMVLDRTAQTAKCLTAEFSEDLLLVGHGASVVGTTHGLVAGTPEVNAALCCLVKLVRHELGWEMELNGDTSHLSQTEDVIRFN